MPKMRSADLPFDGKTNRFIEYFVNTEDLKRTANMANISLEEAKRVFKRKEVRAVIDKRLDVIHNEQAKLIAKSKQVTVLYLDDQLVVAVKKGAARGDTKALEMGYQRISMFRDGEFVGIAAPPPIVPAGEARQLIFRRERTITHTEQITGTPQQPALPAGEEVLPYWTEESPPR